MSGKDGPGTFGVLLAVVGSGQCGALPPAFGLIRDDPPHYDWALQDRPGCASVRSSQVQVEPTQLDPDKPQGAHLSGAYGRRGAGVGEARGRRGAVLAERAAEVGSPIARPDGGMADAEDSKSFARKGVRVQLPLRAPFRRIVSGGSQS